MSSCRIAASQSRAEEMKLPPAIRAMILAAVTVVPWGAIIWTTSLLA
ncbi:hypothetical protein [Indioceanicola profundi]|nr:hypothetical protein [Indioceanicola profundi]